MLHGDALCFSERVRGWGRDDRFIPLTDSETRPYSVSGGERIGRYPQGGLARKSAFPIRARRKPMKPRNFELRIIAWY